ncbi:MAG: hypothetical protein M3P93_02670 [Actinomycetota bacterium]|nr:hypothetical protein [Actinomycetota bacterium]
MRVSTTSIYLTTSRGLGAALGRVQEVSEKLSSGRQVNAWSDDTPAATSATAYRAQEADWTSFARSVTDAKGWLDATDGTLQSMSSLLTRVRGLATSAVNGGLSSQARQAVGDEIEQLRTELRDLGQTRHLGRSLFGGFGEHALATDGSGRVSYAGDDGAVRRQVSPTVVLPVNVGGRELFGFDDSGADVFATLTELADVARSGDTTAMSGLQHRLEGHAAAVRNGLSKVGATYNQVDAAGQAGSVALQDIASRRTELEDVDIAEAVLKLNAAQASYQAALGAAAKANLPSLADFLR